MSHFLIYLPQEAAKKKNPLESVGLPALVPNAEFISSTGPDKGSGSMVAWRKPGGDPRANFKPEEQRWVPAFPSGDLAAARYWLGYFLDSTPKPEEIKRPDFRAGFFVQLGDGQKWLFPSIEELPRDFARGDDGRFTLKVQPRFKDFFAEAEKWVRLVTEGGEKADDAPKLLNFFELVAFVEKALAMNYRLPPELSNELLLFNTENIRTAFWAVMGRGSTD